MLPDSIPYLIHVGEFYANGTTKTSVDCLFRTPIPGTDDDTPGRLLRKHSLAFAYKMSMKK